MMSMLKNDLNVILHREELEKGIQKYIYIMDFLKNTDVTTDIEFQKKYKSFFAMGRKNKIYYEVYFNLLEQSKNNPIPFSKVLNHIHENTKQFHCSFGSKLVHVTNPNEPIWDNIVSNQHFGFKLPYPSAKNREERINIVYSNYRDAFFDFISSEEGQKIIKAFNDKFPEYASKISNTKKIDFVLWQDR